MVEIVQATFRRKQAKAPLVAVGIAAHVDLKDPRSKQAFESLSVQTYPNFDVLTLDIHKAQLSLGAARNEFVSASKAEFITFMDQLDMMLPDTLQSMLDVLKLHQQEDRTTVHVSTGALVHRDGEMMLSSHRSPGLYKREWLIKHPFPVEAFTFPDPHHREKLAASKQASFHIGHHFGYVYRDAPFRLDGVNP